VKLRQKPPLPPRWQPPAEGSILASLLAYSGLVGSVAVAAASALELDPFGNFHWDQQDITRALLMASPVYAFTMLIMLPEWSQWSLPDLGELTSSSAPSFKGSSADALRAGKQQAEAPAAAPPAAGADAPGADASPAAAQAAEASDEPWLSRPPVSPSAAADEGTAQPSTSAPSQPELQPASPAPRSRFGMDGPIVSSNGAPWRPSQQGGSSSGRALAAFKDAMHLAQGYYIGNNPSKARLPHLAPFARLLAGCLLACLLLLAVLHHQAGPSPRPGPPHLPPQPRGRPRPHLPCAPATPTPPLQGLSVALEAAIILVESLSGEMLYRGVAITWAAAWITDRLYEAGADDDILLANGSVITATDAGKWGAVVAGALAALPWQRRPAVCSCRHRPREPPRRHLPRPTCFLPAFPAAQAACWPSG
jgi:hypothetical protein